MKIFVCKMCGRAIVVIDDNSIPFYCYFDRTSMMESIDEKKAIAMGIIFKDPIDHIGFEFVGDICFDPFTGKEREITGESNLSITLDNWQIAKLAEFIQKGTN